LAKTSYENTINTTAKMQQIAEIAHENLQEQPTPSATRLFGVRDMVEVDVVLHPASSAAFNMEFDLARTQHFTSPMLRLYSWQPFAVSLGAHQRERDVNPEACRDRGYDLVRRPTGGRAILHADELTYSVVLPLTTDEEPKRTIHDVYRDVHLLLLKALQTLGAGAGLTFQKSQTDFRALYRTGQVSMPCFGSSARYELMFEGRKIVGSAQKLFGNVVLQHGSLLLGAGHEDLVEVLNIPTDEERITMRRILHEQTATMQECLGRRVEWDDAATAIVRAFGRG
jgi:lipoate-protein ligase A